MTPNALLDSALSYHARGWACIDIPYRSKKPRRGGWPNERLNEAELRKRFAGRGRNLSVLTGPPSGGLLDVDLDAPEALLIADHFLPTTAGVFGRASKPRSHRLYVISPVLPTKKFQDPLRPAQSAMLVEFRSGGGHTVFPPSVHECGELIAWESDGDPAQCDGPALVGCVERLATAILLARYWPKAGSRHDCALALAGTLLRDDCSQEETEDFLAAVALAAGDEEIPDRVAAVLTTDTRLRTGQPTTGMPTLKTFFDERVIARINEWLHLDRLKHTGQSLGDAPAESAEKPTICISNRHMHAITADALDALRGANDPTKFFDRGGALVRLRDDGSRAWSEVLHVDAARGEVDRAAWFVRLDRNGFPLPARPPQDVIRDLLSLPKIPFPKLHGISQTPVLTTTGFLTSNGYDGDSGLYVSLGDLDDLRTDLSIAEATDVLLDEMLGDFPFVAQSDRAHALAILLLPFVRPAIHGPTPIGLVSAPDRGTGKGLFAECVSLVALGRSAEVMADSGDEGETRKRITALLMEGHPIIQLDNLTELRSPRLAAAITAEVWSDRILGSTRTVRMPQRACWIATANNPTISSELVRRIIEVRLDAGVPRPEERSGWRHPDLLGWVSANRALLVSACLSLIQAWLDAGRPAGTMGTPLGRFEKWAALMGGILEVAGIPSFLEGRERLHAQADAETEDWTAFVTAWYGACGGASVVAKDLLRLAVDNDLLIDLRAGRNQLAAQQRLGHALRGRVDRVFACWRIRKSGEGATGNTAYRLQLMGDKTPETPKTPSATHETALEVGGVLAHSGGVLPASSPKTPPVNGHAAGTNPGVSGVFGVSDRLDTTFVDGLSS